MATQHQAPEELVERVQDLLGSLDEIADPVAQARVQELVGAVLELYGAGLERILGVIADAGEGAIHIRKALLDDGIVASLLLIHGLYPVPLEERVTEAIESVRPFLASHGGGVEILSIEDGVARLRLQGSCNGCPASASTLEHALKEAIEEAGPDLLSLEVEGALGPGSKGAKTGGLGKVSGTGPLPSTLAAGLGRLARPEPVVEDEQCEVCGSRISDDHRHLLELEERRILCACEPCIAMRSGVDNYCPVGTRTVWLDDIDFPDALWSAFQLPIGLAFFLRSSGTGTVVALYPSPAGATESELHLESWNALVERNPILEELHTDGEAFVVNRMTEPAERAIVPIDECYRLVGLIKANWTGISGGNAISDAVPKFFNHIRRKAGVS